VATDALSAIMAAETDNVTAVAPRPPALTARQAATLTAAFDTASGIVVTMRDDDGRRTRVRGPHAGQPLPPEQARAADGRPTGGPSKR
jgi:NADPH:quinone reductase-like Zn-dependent oxidoreductase